MDAPRAWILNLDAEFEWLDPGHRASSRLRATVRALAARLREALRGRPGGARTRVVVPDLDPEPAPGTHRIELWAPTPRAQAEARRLGASECGVDPAVAVRVNHRAFAAELMDPDDLPDARFLMETASVLEVLSRDSERTYVLKRPLGFSGRMRKVVRGADLRAPDRTWIESSMFGASGGLQVEPLLARSLDVALHGHADRAGTVRLGWPVVSVYDERGAWGGARRVAEGELNAAETAALGATAGRVGESLVEAGYYGPFGIDAFRWSDAGRSRFRPLVEINARHTMAGLVAGDLETLLGVR